MGRYNSKEQARSRTLDDNEIRKIWAATAPNYKSPFHALVRFLLLTGCRRNEARYLLWAEIDGTDWALPASRNKTKVDLPRPLSKAAQALLADQPHIDGGPFVFTNDGHRPLSESKPKKAFDAACDVSSWTLHDLRRSARTLMSRAGISADTAERCLGHVLGGVRAVYDQHKYQEEMQEAFEALAAQIERIVNPSKGDVVQLRRRARAKP